MPALLVAALIWWGACAPETRVTPDLVPDSVASADTVELGAGKTAVVGATRLRITFEKVAGDSRCPRGVTCVWEGDATVVLALVLEGHAPATIQLHTSPTLKQAETHYGGFTIALQELLPYPEAGGTIDPGAYRVRLRVTADAR